MIANDQELQGTQERITLFYRLLAQMRITATTPEEYRLFSNSYLAEIERMHAAVLTYLKRHASEPVPAEAALGRLKPSIRGRYFLPGIWH